MTDSDVRELLATKDPRDLQRHEAVAIVEYLLDQRDRNLPIYRAGVQAITNGLMTEWEV